MSPGELLITALVVIGLIMAAGVAYFLPTIIAVRQNHHLTAAIALVNLVFGFTVIGWVVALCMALVPPRREGA
jgi:hypothetical protein